MSHAAAIQKAEPGIFTLTLTLGAATTLAGLVLGLVAYVTMPAAIENDAKRKEAARQAILPQAASFEEMAGHHGWFAGKDASGRIIGYVVPAEGRGYGGGIAIALGLDADLKIVDYKILAHNETPGLGEIAKKDKFRAQFKGRGADQMEYTKRQEAGKIQAITGATITTKAVVGALTDAMKALDAALKQPAGAARPALPGGQEAHHE
ncbi:MAG: FMN-binding protein [Myxococcales bacterium]|nr:MAG: FMN-binding protein [Myxococcales bacterium]